MRLVKQTLSLAAVVAVMLISSCSDDDQDPNPNPSGDVTISGVSTGHFWGEEMTITGTGFSAVKEENIVKFTGTSPSPVFCSVKYTSVEGDIEIVSATATQIKIKVPVRRNSFGDPVCGPHSANLEVTVNEKTAKFDGMKFGPLPYIGGFLYHYGWFDVPSVTKIGDSVMIDGGLMATAPNSSEYWDDVRLSINGIQIPIKHRSIGLESGWAFYLPVEQFVEMNCSTEPDDWGAREMDFKFYIEGTNKSAERKLFVKYLPDMIATCGECPSSVSKSGTVAVWKVNGTNMNYPRARFSPISCGGAAQDLNVFNPAWSSNLQFEIPVSILAASCSYGVYLVNDCEEKYLGSVNITN